jgi:hypothetical protein
MCVFDKGGGYNAEVLPESRSAGSQVGLLLYQFAADDFVYFVR